MIAARQIFAVAVDSV